MSKPEAPGPQIRPHSVDGIEEYDNPLPRWWVWLFYGSIVFAAGYAVCFPAIPGVPGALAWSQISQYKREVAAAPTPAPAGEVKAQTLLADIAAVTAGRDTFRRNCAACHGPEGKGSIGPSLRDGVWVHGQGEVGEILEIVAGGTAKGMPAWKGQLAPAALEQVAAFVHGLSHPDDPYHPALP